ncbi:MAG: ketoacyl-ACP synthase III [Actinomycetota bacterium]
MVSVGVLGFGAYVPSRVVTNDEVERETGFCRESKKGRSLAEWVERHHGGVERRRAAPDQATSDLVVEAVTEALGDAAMSAHDVELLVLSTYTSDFRIPNSAGEVQTKLSMDGKFLQLDAACTGLLDAVHVGSALVETGQYGSALVACGDSMEFLMAPDDWLSRTVFGDGASALVLGEVDDGYGFIALQTGSDGELGHYVKAPGGGSHDPEAVRDDLYVRPLYSEIHSWGVDRMVHATKLVLDQAGLTIDDVNWVVPHQASRPIVRAAGRALGVSDDRVVTVYERYGNTSGSSIGIAFYEAARSGRFQRGDLILLPAVGAGMAWSAALYRWPGS